MPSEAIEQLQQGIMNDLQAQPGTSAEVEFLEETLQPSKNVDKQSANSKDKESDEQEASSSRIDQQKQIKACNFDLTNQTKIRFVNNDSMKIYHWALLNVLLGVPLENLGPSCAARN